MKKIIAGLALLIVVVGGFYFGSPYWAAYQLRDTIVSGDVDRIEGAVDFPSVRESLKSQMTLIMTEKMQNDPELADNPFAGLGMALMPTIIDKAIDSYVTPEGLARLAEKAEEGRDPDYEFDWVGLDRFRITPAGESEEGVSLTLERRGFASWKVIRVNFPEEVFSEEQ